MRFRLDAFPLTSTADRLERPIDGEATSVITEGRTAHDALQRFARADQSMVIATVAELNDELTATVRREDSWYEIELRKERFS